MSLAKIRRSLGKHGVLPTLRRCLDAGIDWVRWRVDARFDRRHDVDTAGRLAIADLAVASANASQATWYEPVPNAAFRQLMAELRIRHETFTFVDYGSGKGRVLFLASDYPFETILGVEFSEELHRVAERNFGTYRNPRQQCRNLRSICADAADFELPLKPLVLFFYSPFRAPLFGRILDRVKASLAAHPRELYLLYVGVLPELIELLRNSGLAFREVPLTRDYLRGTKKRGFILHHPPRS